MLVSHPHPPLLLPLLLLECAFGLPTTRAETQTYDSQVPSVPALDSSTAVRHTRPVRRQHCRGHPRLVRKILVYLLPVCPVTQHQLPLVRAHGLLRRLLQILTAQYRQREPTCRARFPSARVRFRGREHALRAPFSSAMVRGRRREPAFTTPFLSAAASIRRRGYTCQRRPPQPWQGSPSFTHRSPQPCVAQQ